MLNLDDPQVQAVLQSLVLMVITALGGVLTTAIGLASKKMLQLLDGKAHAGCHRNLDLGRWRILDVGCLGGAPAVCHVQWVQVGVDARAPAVADACASADAAAAVLVGFHLAACA